MLLLFDGIVHSWSVSHFVPAASCHLDTCFTSIHILSGVFERLGSFCKWHLQIGGLEGAVKNELPVKCEVVRRWPLAAGETAAGGLVEGGVNF